MNQLIIATHNVHKLREFREILKAVKGLEILSLLQFADYIPPPEDQDTFEGNVIVKAVDAAQKLGIWTLADDSGLVVPRLNGAPGVYSRRYSGEKATDKDNREKLLKEMTHLEGIDRTAYFECALALSSPNGLQKVVTGRCEGLIISEEKGRNGFGYDSLFVKHDYDKTFAEIGDDLKNKISHRAKAFEKLIPYISSLT